MLLLLLCQSLGIVGDMIPHWFCAFWCDQWSQCVNCRLFPRWGRWLKAGCWKTGFVMQYTPSTTYTGLLFKKTRFCTLEFYFFHSYYYGIYHWDTLANAHHIHSSQPITLTAQSSQMGGNAKALKKKWPFPPMWILGNWQVCERRPGNLVERACTEEGTWSKIITI